MKVPDTFIPLVEQVNKSDAGDAVVREATFMSKKNQVMQQMMESTLL
ncbi:MAG: hypothetical protein UW94_C0005G0001 [Parcubacteria group bacterium GW2011_GWA2_45_14]|nr:MAG: hypothetical protein UW94_C0005G0001 [Parcubacteria group bacterium GW2011_GWA2_45_14]